MTVRVWGYLEEYEQEREEILAAVDGVFRSGQLVMGPEVESFEREFAAYHGVAETVGVDNGTNALVLALRALGVGEGDEVVTVSNTAAPTVVAIDAVGARPVFVDIDPDTYLMDTDQLPEAITDRTACLVPVHLYGQCVPMEPVMSLAAEHGLKVLEDCAQAHGSRQGGRLAGTWGDAAAFSFYPTKVLGAYGDGGAVLTDSPGTAQALRRLRYYGMEDRYYVVEVPGYNSRLDEVQAAILRTKLRRLEGYVERRREIADRYEQALEGSGILLPTTRDGNDHVHYVYVVRHPERDRIISMLAEEDVRLNVSYPWPVHTMSGFAGLGYGEGALPVTEAAAKEIFSLPMYPSLPADVQDEVVAGLLRALERL